MSDEPVRAEDVRTAAADESVTDQPDQPVQTSAEHEGLEASLPEEERSDVEVPPQSVPESVSKRLPKRSSGGGILAILLFVVGLLASVAFGGYRWGHDHLEEETRLQIRNEEVARANLNAKRAQESIEEQAYLRGMGDGVSAALPLRVVLSILGLGLVLFVIRRFQVGYKDMSLITLTLLLMAVGGGGYFVVTDPIRVNRWWHTLTGPAPVSPFADKVVDAKFGGHQEIPRVD